MTAFLTREGNRLMTSDHRPVGLACRALSAALAAIALAGTSAAVAEPAAAAEQLSYLQSARDFGFIAGIVVRDGKTYLRFDRARLLTGDAARASRAAHGLDPNDGPDYYIQNDNPRLRLLRVTGNVVVSGSQSLAGTPAQKPVTFQVLRSYVATHHTHRIPAFSLVYDDRGYVVRIAEVYLA
jgi:hypothetical protein